MGDEFAKQLPASRFSAMYIHASGLIWKDGFGINLDKCWCGAVLSGCQDIARRPS